MIVDGYNLIGINHGDLKKERDHLVGVLSEYAKAKGHEIVLVFDGWKSGGNREETVNTGGIRIIYSRLGEKADFVIKRIIKDEKREWIVVSSDREITSYAWSNGSVPVASEEFREIIEHTGSRQLTGEYDLLFEESGSQPRKGRSRTPSRKEKALLRILKKL